MIKSTLIGKYKNISHGFFNKLGGYSTGIYKSLNCGPGSKDNKRNVNKNLRKICIKIKCSKKNLILLNQIHSNKVISINKVPKRKLLGDALITSKKKFALGILTADCAPVFIYDSKKKIISAIHAGWKGALSGIVENTIKTFKKISLNNEIFAAVGPCIDKKSYEVDIIFYEKFVRKSKKNRKYFSDKGKVKKFFNLRKYVTDKLLKLKVKVDQIDKDTFTQKSIFFSYRRSRKLEQRCISTVCIV